MSYNTRFDPPNYNDNVPCIEDLHGYQEYKACTWDYTDQELKEKHRLHCEPEEYFITSNLDMIYENQMGGFFL